MAKGKAIQKVTAWRFPCDPLPFDFPNGDLELPDLDEYNISKTKANLVFCHCQPKSCKPQKIIIEVQVAKVKKGVKGG